HQLLTLRTFSKLYGLAGSRVGYVMGNENLLAPLQAVRPTFEVNRIAIAGAEATLDDLPHSEEVLQKIHGEIARVKKEYTALGFDVLGEHANRSEEHTSELQSRFELVCRLLLEKKNMTYSIDKGKTLLIIVQTGSGRREPCQTGMGLKKQQTTIPTREHITKRAILIQLTTRRRH